MATTEHDDPALPSARTEPDTAQDPESTEYVTSPVPDPPLVVSVKGSPYVAVIDVIANADWLPFANDKAVSTDDTAW
jgi:hypothetical protein